MSDLVGNDKDRFSCDVIQFIVTSFDDYMRAFSDKL